LIQTDYKLNKALPENASLKHANKSKSILTLMEEGGVKCDGKFDEFSAREASQGEALDAAEDGGGVAAERVSSLAELFASSSEIDILLRFESSSSALWTCVKSSNQKRPKRKV
jgi:hypothetical protein